MPAHPDLLGSVQARRPQLVSSPTSFPPSATRTVLPLSYFYCTVSYVTTLTCLFNSRLPGPTCCCAICQLSVTTVHTEPSAHDHSDSFWYLQPAQM